MLLIVGQVVRPHGIRGEVVVEVRTDEPQQRYSVGSVLRTEPTEAGPLTVVDARPHQGRLLVTFEGIADRDVADTLRGVLLCVDSSDVPPSDDPDEFSDHELVGLRAETPAGDDLGEVVRIEHAPASDLLVLRRPDGGSALVPFIKAFVPDVDVASRRIVLTPPDGLFDL
jgi:16S rRNA processing protein RimM